VTVKDLIDDDPMAADVRAGLTAHPKTLPPKYFYDAAGSELFEEITRLPEYYPTRTEAVILAEHAVEIAKVSAADTLVELGSGSSEKTRLLLDGLRETGTLRRYVPVDVSSSALAGAAGALQAEYPGMRIEPVVADFTRHLDRLPGGGRKLLAFLGGTIGNLTPTERARFLAAVAANLGAGDMLLLGTDLVKDPARLVAAYDDAAGVTAAFNRNVLRVINRELSADFVLERFAHRAVWNAEYEWIEMRLAATAAHTVRIGRLGLDVDFAAGEEIRTEISAKFRREGVAAELAAAGLALHSWWTDPAEDFALSLAVPE
jgi:L-histidine Nalpha-methyltransferase